MPPTIHNTSGSDLTEHSTSDLGGSVIVVNKPTATVAGDLLVAQVIHQNNDPSGVTNNAGLTLWGTSTSWSNQLWQAIYTKIATGSEGSTITFTFADIGTQLIGMVVVFRVTGHHATAPLDGNPTHAPPTNNFTNPTVASKTVTAEESLYVLIGATDDPTSSTAPTGMTEAIDVEASSGSVDITSCVDYQVMNTVGATGTKQTAFAVPGIGQYTLASGMIIAPSDTTTGWSVGYARI